GGDKCIELLRMIFLNTSDGVQELIRRTHEDVDSEVNWTVGKIANWRKEFFVELAEVKLLENDSISDEHLSENATDITDEHISNATNIDSLTEGDDENDE
ncbi:MAG: hypothetical protein ACYT04_93500, partial [Nostoc sp.]